MGLLLQLVLLPHVFPQIHAGNGLLANRDWVGFHDLAVAIAQKIYQDGWNEFLLRPDGDNAITGLTSFFYVLFGPYPWTLLPLNALMFTIGAVSLFSILRYLDLDHKQAVIATLPYLIFPSALLQYGQIHKDVFCTAGLLVVLWSWVGLLHEGRKLWKIFLLVAASTAALLIVSTFRPYLLLPIQGLGILLLLWFTVRAAWQFVRIWKVSTEKKYQTELIYIAQSITILAILNALVYVVSTNHIDVRVRSLPNQDAHSKVTVPIFIWQSNTGVRSVGNSQTFSGSTLSEVMPTKEIEDVMRESIEECRPVVILKDDAFFENMINRVFIKIAVSRAGFTTFAHGTTAATNIDQDIKFCKKEDLIRYIPRAMQLALFAPFPSNWFTFERRNSTAMEVFISALEMSICYVAYVGLLYWLVSFRRWTSALVVPIGFALGMTLLLGLTVANVGTLYRMRFPYAMIFVSIGIAGLLQFFKIKKTVVDIVDSKTH